jgi:hypothetical protein
VIAALRRHARLAAAFFLAAALALWLLVDALDYARRFGGPEEEQGSPG